VEQVVDGGCWRGVATRHCWLAPAHGEPVSDAGSIHDGGDEPACSRLGRARSRSCRAWCSCSAGKAERE
jgi:hypothetical protein